MKKKSSKQTVSSFNVLFIDRFWSVSVRFGPFRIITVILCRVETCEERWRRKRNERSEQCTKRRCKSCASDGRGPCPPTTPPEKVPITILASPPPSPLTACPSRPLPPRATPKAPKTTPLCSPSSTFPRRHRHRRPRRRRRLPLFPNTLSLFPHSLLSLSLRFATRLLVPSPLCSRVIIVLLARVYLFIYYFIYLFICISWWLSWMWFPWQGM